MKLQVAKIDSQAEGFVNNTQFGIGDTAMVMEVLRNQLYTDPLFSSVREYLCNARDANREAGNPAPIEVTLPNAYNLFLTILDNGPGISPERMANTFCQFGNSTKRHTNELTGGFGLGGKSGFAYSDNFNIISIVDGVRRTYTAYIDATRLGAMTLLKEEITDLPNGTSIVMPIKREDVERTAIIIKAVTYFWSTRPIFFSGSNNADNVFVRKPATIQYSENEEVLYSGTNWSSVKATRYDSLERYSSYRNNKAIVLVDEIPYELNIGKFNHNEQAKINLLISNNFRIKFNNGDLSLSASRDNIAYDPKTIKALIGAVDLITSELNSKIEASIAEKPTYLEALIQNLEIAGTISNFNLSKNVQWKGRQCYHNNESSHFFWGNAVLVYNIGPHQKKTNSTGISLLEFFKLAKDNPQKLYLADDDKYSYVQYAKHLCATNNIPNVWFIKINQDYIEKIQDKSQKDLLAPKIQLITEFVTNKLSEVVIVKQKTVRANTVRVSVKDKGNVLAYDLNGLLTSQRPSPAEFSLNENIAYTLYDYTKNGSIESKILFTGTKERVPPRILNYRIADLVSILGVSNIVSITQSKIENVKNSKWISLEDALKLKKEQIEKTLSKKDMDSIFFEDKLVRIINSSRSSFSSESMYQYLCDFIVYKNSQKPTPNAEYSISRTKFQNLLDKDSDNILHKIIERYNFIEKNIGNVRIYHLIDGTANPIVSNYKVMSKIEDLKALELVEDNIISSFLTFIKNNADLFKSFSEGKAIYHNSYDSVIEIIINNIISYMPHSRAQFFNLLK